MEVGEERVEAAAELAVRKLKDLDARSEKDVQAAKQEAAHDVQSSRIPKNSDLLRFVDEEDGYLRALLTIKPRRNLSGIAVVAAMTKPLPCPPQAQCLYCPGGMAVSSPKSYTGREPAALRGAQNGYDPFLQVTSRLRQLEDIGHSTAKVELIVMGGTFLNFGVDYQEAFVKGLYDALNGRGSKTLQDSITANEKADKRCVGLTVETRPDCLKETDVDRLLSFGGTRVEIGVQSLHDDVLKYVRRGHTVKQTAEAFRTARDAGLKIVAHMMPGLPGSTLERDFDSFRTLFEDERFRPDMLKIYPTLVVRSAPLYEMYIRGEYAPYDTEQMVDLVARVKAITPPWVRIMRVQRDIPAQLIEAGIRASNLRELAQERLRSAGGKCSCIRCREVGLRSIPPGRRDNFTLRKRAYYASGGEEHFFSYEDEEGDLAAFLRMRVPSQSAHRPEIDSGTAIVRELRVYGRLVDLGKRSATGWQHRGLGAQLMREAEEAALSSGRTEMIVISAVGTREYYRRLGYERRGPYMAKRLH
jgi:elongator complex protein 3